MSNYLNNLLTTTTSKYNTLRRTLLSDEADGDTEDDSHIARALRAYYTEKGRQFPQWLPPDPKAPHAAPVRMVSSAGRGYGQTGQQQPMMGRGGGGGLGDLWDSPSQAAPQQQEPMSLRRAQGRGGGGLRGNNSLPPEPQMQGRPLPSQRAGSQQSTSSFRNELAPQTTGGSATSAQDRLKARLWGSGKSQNPSPATSPAPPAGMRSQYDRPQTGGGRAPYSDDGGSGGGYSGGGRQQNNSNMSANSPWSGGNDDPYGPSYSRAPPPPQQQQPPERRRMGLPNGPRMR
ncbi:hypothetical protein PMIN06_000231 [Paraphaeosphaeria minitans]|uniref:Mso1 N-terminal domain-containing protein n=1 Tax=Paraphaeosphaeria minitans TaxID=565426 RepID=A0A9P6KMR7_9PLEO|nr:hypothetical protein PMIN01_09910 [Paraphaeosphaeria minitans]